MNKITPQDVPVETCMEIARLINMKAEGLQFVVVLFDDESHRNFGHGCKKCTSEMLFQVAGELAGENHDEAAH